MSVESPGREVSGTFGMRAVAMGNEGDDVAVAARALRHRPGKSGYRERVCDGRRCPEVPRLICREVQGYGNVDGLRQVGDNLGCVCQLDACLQRARSITVPQFAQVRRSELA